MRIVAACRRVAPPCGCRNVPSFACAPEMRPERDRLGHGVTRPVGDACSVRERCEIGLVRGEIQPQNLLGVAHEDDGDLLARDGKFRLERRGLRAGHDTVLVRPHDRVLIPVGCEIGERRAVIRLRAAGEIVEDLHYRARAFTPSGVISHSRLRRT